MRTVSAVIVMLTLFAVASPTRTAAQSGCNNCQGCQGVSGWHEYAGPASGWGRIFNHGCAYALEGCFVHGACYNPSSIQSEEELDVLFGRLAVASDDELRRLVDRHADIVVVNEERASLQLRGCDDAIIANLPLDATRLSAVLASPTPGRASSPDR